MVLSAPRRAVSFQAANGVEHRQQPNQLAGIVVNETLKLKRYAVTSFHYLALLIL
jgi:hypothetical protein